MSSQVTTEKTQTNKPQTAPAGQGNQSAWDGVWRDILGGGVVRSLLAILLALLIGSLLVVATNPAVQNAAGYFFSRPQDTFIEAGKVISGAFRSIWEGAIFSPRTGFQPFTQTLMWATPLISAGLGIALGFRAGLFNIGGRGQMLLAALFTGFVGASLPMPPGLHLIVAVIAGIIGGALWAGLVGVLKARTGAHEVIVTIMLNYVAFWGVTYLLKTAPFQAEGAGGNAKAKAIVDSAVLPKIIGAVDVGFILTILAVLAYWWLMDRSTIGFQIRAVGLNPDAARTAGINVGRVTVVTMALSGAFLGLAGATQVLGRNPTGYTPAVDAGIGFDAITVALLGANHPVGIVLAGILFGALKAGSFPMQVTEGIPIDIVAVIQGLIVLFIAAPPLVRAIFRLPAPTGISLLDRMKVARGKAEPVEVAAAAGIGSAVQAAPVSSSSAGTSTKTAEADAGTAKSEPLAVDPETAEEAQGAIANRMETPESSGAPPLDGSTTPESAPSSTNDTPEASR